MADVLKQLSDFGVAIWLDDLDRERIQSGQLAQVMASRHVAGVTTNPSIFDHAISSGAAAYADQIDDLRVRGVDVGEAVRAITTMDVRAACDVLRPVHDSRGKGDGRVSIEVDPRLARKTAETIAEARALWWQVDRPNLYIKIPATLEGLPAITKVLGEGISVNVTLIFSVERYRAVLDAWLDGLEQAHAAGLDLSQIASVASFFVSRVDTEIDKRLNELGTAEALELRGKAAIANARLAWAAYEEVLAGDRWAALKAAGAQPQRPLWASTGVKDKAYDDTRYVIDLAAPGCVNTMPEATMEAVHDHGVFKGDTVSGTEVESAQVFADLEAIGIKEDDVVTVLEDEGVEKFIASWQQLLDNLQASLDQGR
jgi:transaldolase